MVRKIGASRRYEPVREGLRAIRSWPFAKKSSDPEPTTWAAVQNRTTRQESLGMLSQLVDHVNNFLEAD